MFKKNYPNLAIYSLLLLLLLFNVHIFPKLFLRAHFSYDPKNDNLIPCKEAGLKFSAGSVLQVLKQEDPYWWQVN